MTRVLPGVAIVALLTGACGSSLTTAQLQAANGSFATPGQQPAQSGTTQGTAPTSGSGSLPGGATNQPGASTGGGAIGGTTQSQSSGHSGQATVSGSGPSSQSHTTGTTTQPGNRPPIILGTFGTESGVVGAAVASAVPAIHAWQDMVNAQGGLDGHPVQIVYGGDDGGDPGQANAIAHKLIDQDHVEAFLTTHSPTAMQGALPYIDQKRIPVIADQSQVVPGDTSPMEFDPQVGLKQSGYAFATTLFDQAPNVRKIAVVSLAEIATAAASVTAIKEQAAARHRQIVYSAAVSIAQPDFTAEMLQAKNAGAQAIICVTDLQTALRIEASAARQNYHPLFSSTYSFDIQITGSAAKQAQGFLAYAPSQDFEGPRATAYQHAMSQYEPGQPRGFAGETAFVGGAVLQKIAPQLPAGQVTPADMIKALRTLHNETLGGLVPSFTFGTGSPPFTQKCFLPIRFNNGHWTSNEKFVCNPKP